MNANRTRRGLRWYGACWSALVLSAVCAQGGIVTPLYVGNVSPVQDQYGRVLAGSLLVSGAATRSLVEIRTAEDGVIRPPSTNGAANYKNPLLTPESTGGMGMNSMAADSGLFSMVFAQRPAPGTKIFARAYNAPTAAEATFYADSQLVTLASSNASSLVVVFKAALPLDPGDDDGDGLNNSWEQALGIDDRLTPDYDGDGMSDLHEMLAGTAADDPGSNLAFKLIRREPGAVPASEGEMWSNPVRVRWQAVPGKKYRLEHVPMLGANDPATGEAYAFELVDEVVAEDGEYEIDMLVNVPSNALTGTFRVKLVVEE